MSSMTMSMLQSATCKATAIAKSRSSSTAVTRHLLAGGAARPVIRTYAQVSKEDNQGMVQFQPFDEVSSDSRDF